MATNAETLRTPSAEKAEAQAVTAPREAAPVPAAPSATAMVSAQERDMVDGRFRINLQQPLGHLNTSLCNAYEVIDTRNEVSDLYALIAPNSFPYRRKAIEALKTINSPHLSHCYASAPVMLSSPAETRMAFVFNQPPGKSLSQLIQEQGALKDKQAISHILSPLCSVLSQLHAHKINHGNIHPDRIYVGEQGIFVTECVSEPSGFSQDYHYEPPERILSQAAAKGSGNLVADCYALGVLAIFLCRGALPYENLSEKQFIHRVLHMGGYNAFMQALDFTENMLDLLRGTLQDDPLERWDTATMRTCLDGKRYNLIPPTMPRDSSRPFSFAEEEYFNHSALANALHKQWQKARTELSPVKLVKWMELSTSKSDKAERMAKLLRVTSSDAPDADRQLNDTEITRIIAVLSPYGPMRLKDLSITIDGLATALADAFRNSDVGAQRSMMLLIESGLPGFLSEIYDQNHNSEASNTLWQLQNLRPLLTSKGLGFGIERVLYHLNPSLACQSEMLMPFHCDTIAETLQALEFLAATNQHKNLSLIDSHLAAYIANKLDIKKEIKVVELSAYPDFANDQRLILLKLLAMAQQKSGAKKYPELTQWALNMTMPIIGKLHQRSGRELFIKEAKKAAKTASLENLAFTLFKPDIFHADSRDYQTAKNLHKYHNEWIEKLQDSKRLLHESRLLGRQVSVIIAYFVLGLTLYYVFDPYISF